MRLNKFIISGFVSLIAFSQLNAQNVFEKELFLQDKDTLPYNILVPSNYKLNGTNEGAEVSKTRYPLVLFLHGSGERGNDNEVQIMHIKKLFLDKENQKKHPAFVIAPQCPKEERWVEVDWDLSTHTMQKEVSRPLRLSWDLLQNLLEIYPIDENRIYVTGLSMGGFGSWEIIIRHPGKFAAAIPICGGVDETMAHLILDMPIWAFHGSKDKVVPVSRTRNMIKTLKNNGGNPKYTEYNGVGHDSWTRAYKENGLLDWLFKQTK